MPFSVTYADSTRGRSTSSTTKSTKSAISMAGRVGRHKLDQQSRMLSSHPPIEHESEMPACKVLVGNIYHNVFPELGRLGKHA